MTPAPLRPAGLPASSRPRGIVVHADRSPRQTPGWSPRPGCRDRRCGNGVGRVQRPLRGADTGLPDDAVAPPSVPDDPSPRFPQRVQRRATPPPARGIPSPPRPRPRLPLLMCLVRVVLTAERRPLHVPGVSDHARRRLGSPSIPVRPFGQGPGEPGTGAGRRASRRGSGGRADFETQIQTLAAAGHTRSLLLGASRPGRGSGERSCPHPRRLLHSPAPGGAQTLEMASRPDAESPPPSRTPAASRRLRWFGSAGRVSLGAGFSIWLAPRPTGEGSRLFPLEWERRPRWRATAPVPWRGCVCRAIVRLRRPAAPGGWGDAFR